MSPKNNPMGMPRAVSDGMKVAKACGAAACNMLAMYCNSICDARRFNLPLLHVSARTPSCAKLEKYRSSSSPRALVTLRHDLARRRDAQHGVAENLRTRATRGQAGGYATGRRARPTRTLREAYANPQKTEKTTSRETRQLDQTGSNNCNDSDRARPEDSRKREGEGE